MKTDFKSFILLEFSGAELELDKTLQYNNTLNPKIWKENSLRKEVEGALEKIAKEFIDFLEIPEADVKDIIITGSNANFNWTKFSDIDLHIVADFSNNSFCKECNNEFVNTCFQAKKSLWNNTHDITINGHPVEVYVQDVEEKHIATGVYSLKDEKWKIKPERRSVTYDNVAVKLKALELMTQIDQMVENMSDDEDALSKLKEKIQTMRKSGLQNAGEFSVENLAFKTLRNTGYLQKLSNHIARMKDKSLSVNSDKP